MLKKLQRKFIVLATAISMVVLIGVAVAINVVNYYSINRYSESVLNLLIENNMTFSDSFLSRGEFSSEIEYTTRYFVVRIDSQHNVGLIDTQKISSVSSDQAAEYAQLVYNNGDEEGIIDNFRYKRSDTDYGYTYVFLDIEDELRGFNAYILYTVIITAASVLLIFIFACLLSKKAVSPIATSYERQKRFITDVSHELKTPLAIIKADSDVLEIDNGETEWTTSIRTQVARLNNLVENLITLTKMDEEKEQLHSAEFCLSDVVVKTLDEFHATAKSSYVDFSKNIEANVMCKGEESSIRKLVEILVENAIKYSVENTMIIVTLTVNGNRKNLSIENASKNVPVGKHNSWFDRFYREDTVRNGESKGYGIGLSIAKTICDKHNAKITAESKTGSETVVNVIFM